MVPQDQQVDVASPGMISEELDLVSGFGIDKFTTYAHWPRRRNPFARCEQAGAVVQRTLELLVAPAPCRHLWLRQRAGETPDRKSTRLNSSHVKISYAVFCLKK